MDLDELIRALEAQIAEAEQLKSKQFRCPEWSGWRARTRSLIDKPNQVASLQEFEGLWFWSRQYHVYGMSERDAALLNQAIYENDLTATQELLRRLIDELRRKKPRMGFV